MAGDLLLTLARDLKRRKARERRTLFVAEGARTVGELLQSTFAVRGLLATAAFSETGRGRALLDAASLRGVPLTEVSDEELLSAADTEHPQGVLAVAEMPDHSLDSLAPVLGQRARVLILDAVQDPGNVGTLLRTGAALGVAAIVALTGTADLWNAKAVRAAAGAHFHVPALHCAADELVPFLRAHDLPLWGSAAAGTPLDQLTAPDRLAIAFGNEGAGLSAPVREAAACLVALPMAPGIESLNVAVAAGIILYALRP
jgi:TrmH family RNA methyltransferase